MAVGQIHLMGNPPLTEPLQPENAKPRPLGHWGTSPGPNLVHTHLNRAVEACGQDALCVWPRPRRTGGARQLLVEGTYGETCPEPGSHHPLDD